MRQRRNAREISFRISIALKGLIAALEIVGGVALAAVSPAFVLRPKTQDGIISAVEGDVDTPSHGFPDNSRRRRSLGYV